MLVKRLETVFPVEILLSSAPKDPNQSHFSSPIQKYIFENV